MRKKCTRLFRYHCSARRKNMSMIFLGCYFHIIFTETLINKNTLSLNWFHFNLLKIWRILTHFLQLLINSSSNKYWITESIFPDYFLRNIQKYLLEQHAWRNPFSIRILEKVKVLAFLSFKEAGGGWGGGGGGGGGGLNIVLVDSSASSLMNSMLKLLIFDEKDFRFFTLLKGFIKDY